MNSDNTLYLGGRSNSSARPLIVGLGGTARPGSSTENALRLALEAASKQGADTEIFAGPALDVPIYAPEKGERSDASLRLVEALKRCDGLILASPAYHGSISGLVKNAIDYTEDLRQAERTYLDGIAVGCVVTCAGWQAGGQTLAAMRSIVHSLRGWPTPMGVVINTVNAPFDFNGRCVDSTIEAQLHIVGRQVVDFATLRRSAAAA
ncbi:NADPH-dependent FMN reductase [Pseudorhodoplanes sinuspersici]|uniref:Uncharacterized protein n=1 Tax=Pseudorhodoplanes sinuspersici TaxID=1235591 RepID=A0A1W6ZKR5_9HYPH|nr:NAD(P)H-dependent oxidoreductase [Pseudorhodoplanes sinuspersici]ARP98008.1 hypothetical protein CAK95_02125 [Pseudorhodoplanes sinuspersici]RKE68238.1 FMN reductase [Pseudorhodoplanes sinuspersici]